MKSMSWPPVTPVINPLPYRDSREGFLRLLEEMARGAEVICGLPLFYLPENLQGRIDVLEKRPGKNSHFGDYHYVVKEIKLAAHIEENHILQAAFYTYLLSLIQGCLPDCFYVINRDLEEKEYGYGDYEKSLQEAISGTKRILEGSEQPSPTYNGAQWPWMTYTNHMALRLRDVSLVSQVGPRMKEKLAARGLRKVWDLSSATPERLQDIPGVGRTTAERLIVNARAIQKREMHPSRPVGTAFQRLPQGAVSRSGGHRSVGRGRRAWSRSTT